MTFGSSLLSGGWKNRRRFEKSGFQDIVYILALLIDSRTQLITVLCKKKEKNYVLPLIDVLKTMIAARKRGDYTEMALTCPLH